MSIKINNTNTYKPNFKAYFSENSKRYLDTMLIGVDKMNEEQKKDVAESVYRITQLSENEIDIDKFEYKRAENDDENPTAVFSLWNLENGGKKTVEVPVTKQIITDFLNAVANTGQELWGCRSSEGLTFPGRNWYADDVELNPENLKKENIMEILTNKNARPIVPVEMAEEFCCKTIANLRSKLSDSKSTVYWQKKEINQKTETVNCKADFYEERKAIIDKKKLESKNSLYDPDKNFSQWKAYCAWIKT